jgi:fumarate reductase (CoM/CoB) subunit A
MDSHQEIETDVLIVGSEAAGARTAIDLADRELKVLMVTKSIMAKSAATIKAAFSVSGAFGFADPRDNPIEHMKDTVLAGRYLNNQRLVEIVATEGPKRLDELGRWGVKWEKSLDGRYLQVKMYGHSYPRSLTVGFSTCIGADWMRVLRREVESRPLITLRNDVFVTSYFISSKGEIIGCFAIDMRSGDLLSIRTKAIVDATGGGMYLYRTSSAAPENTGDGLAMSYRIGTELMDMEFVQFYPIQMYFPLTLRGDQSIPGFVRTFLGGRLYNLYGERFMRKYDSERMELTDRDILARAIFMEVKQGKGTPHGGVWLDASYLSDKIIETVIEKMAPKWTIRGINMQEYGIDLRKDPLEVGPAAHFFCGGLKVDENWATNVPGLFAAGEAVAGTNGANRLPGNALEETQVSAVKAGKSAAEYAQGVSLKEIKKEQIETEKRRILKIFEANHRIEIRPIKIIRQLQDLFWYKVGVLRDGKELEKAIEEIERIREEELPRLTVPLNSRIFNRDWIDYLELLNMLDVGEMVAKAALLRTESRGSHYREDYPKSSADWLRNILIKLEGSKMTLNFIPVVKTKIPLPQGGG